MKDIVDAIATKIVGSVPDCEEGARAHPPRNRTRSGGGGGRRVAIVVSDLVRLKFQTVVEFSEWDGEADFRHGEHIALLQDEDAPSVLGANVDGGSDFV